MKPPQITPGPAKESRKGQRPGAVTLWSKTGKCNWSAVMCTTSEHVYAGDEAENKFLKHAEADGEVFLGIFPDRLDEITRLHQHLIAVVVKRWIAQQLARSALARLEAG